MTDPDADAALARDAVREAGALALKYFRASPRHWHKKPGDPVSEADIAIDRLLHARLLGPRPDYGWLSEETEDNPRRIGRARVWVVDPIDGTRAFLRGEPEFCVAVALLAADEPVAGFVFNPATGEFFEALKGQGARLNGQPVHASRRTGLAQAKLLASRRTFEHHHWLKETPDAEFHSVNSIAYRIALVAAGRFDASISLAEKSDWDIAGADLIVREAGGLCTTAGGEPFRYNAPHPRHPSVIAAGAALHPVVVELMKRR